MRHTPITPADIISKDIVLFGGGIAGLWLLDRLRTLGYEAVLLEKSALGAGQSIASQGMIHGGMKYALNGKLGGATEAIAEMPELWRQCLQGKGEVDLRGTRLLADAYYLWPRNSLRSRFAAFLGSKAVRGRVDAVPPAELPALFQGHIKGPLYRLQDLVLDVPSLLGLLAARHQANIYRIDWEQSRLHMGDAGIESVELPDGSLLQAQRWLCTSGEGADFFLQRSPATRSAIQLRPLQMVVVKHQLPHPVYVHCVSDQLSDTPELTITTHDCSDGRKAWYLGGGLAESGVQRSADEQIAYTRQLLKTLFPWRDLSEADFHCLPVNRAEARQPDGKRPDQATLRTAGNVFYCWPTKLTLAPALARQVVETLEQTQVVPGYGSAQPLPGLPAAPLATPPWELC